MNLNFVVGKDFAQHHFLWLGEYGFGYARIQSSYCEGLCFGELFRWLLYFPKSQQKGSFRVQEGFSTNLPFAREVQPLHLSYVRICQWKIGSLEMLHRIALELSHISYWIIFSVFLLFCLFGGHFQYGQTYMHTWITWQPGLGIQRCVAK